MGRIYFHAENETVEVRGAERAYFGGLCGKIFLASISTLIDRHEPERSRILRYIPMDAYVHHNPRALETYLAYGGKENGVYVDREWFPAWVMAMNTVMVSGNDTMRFIARVHGQCEIHAYVRDENTGWLAAIIHWGLKERILRQGMGWDPVIDLLLGHPGTVVMSYSVCRQFPNYEIAGWEGNPNDWYDLPSEEQWRLGLEGLYKRNETASLELSPVNWDMFHYGRGMHGFRLSDIVHRRTDPLLTNTDGGVV